MDYFALSDCFTFVIYLICETINQKDDRILWNHMFRFIQVYPK